MSYLSLTPDIPLPRARQCVAFSSDVRVALRSGLRSWVDLQAELALGLQTFAQRASATAAVWVSDRPFSDGQRRNTRLLTAWFGAASAHSRDDLLAFGEPLGEGWHCDGVFERPPDAFPTLCLHQGQLYQLWVPTTGEPVVVSVGGMMRLTRQERTWDETGPEDFLPHVQHALAAADRVADDPEKERLKLAFAWWVSQRVIEADGVIGEAEMAFLRKAFPADAMSRAGLETDDERETAIAEARSSLAGRLGYHEKLGLLSTFFAACYADGTVEVRELAVLREASAVLGVDRADVVMHLRQLW